MEKVLPIMGTVHFSQHGKYFSLLTLNGLAMEIYSSSHEWAIANEGGGGGGGR